MGCRGAGWTHGDRETPFRTVGLQPWAGAVTEKREEADSPTCILEAPALSLVRRGEREAEPSAANDLCTLGGARPPNSLRREALFPPFHK